MQKKAVKRKQWIGFTLLGLVVLAILFELIRSSTKKGDFIGYVNAGNLVLHHQNIYSDYLNTWPPLFSVISVVIALGDHLSGFGVRFIWSCGSILALFYTLKLSVRLFLNKSLSWRPGTETIWIGNPVVLIPILIMLRFILDNVANIQINMYLMLLTFLAISNFTKRNYMLCGFFLALGISIKVYPIFLLLYFLFKREFKPVGTTLVFILIMNSIPFFVFGFDQAAEYYQHWTLKSSPPPTIDHKNQSLLGGMYRYLTAQDPGWNFYVNIVDLKTSVVKYLYYLIVLIAAIYPAYLFRKKLKDPSNLSSILEYTFVLTAIPLLTPLAWKAYYVFLWFPYLILYILLFLKPQILPRKNQPLKILFLISVIFTVFTTEGIVGNYVADVFESLSLIAVGTILLLIIQIVLYIQINDEVKFWPPPVKPDVK